jgi:hypothetical protein
MSTLSGSSTISEVWAAYDDNASYEEDGSAAKCAAFITACRILLRRQPSRSAKTGGAGGGGSDVQFDPALIAAELERARKWRAVNRTDGPARTVYPDFTYFRD